MDNATESWTFLNRHGLDAPHHEVHEGTRETGEWVMDRHTGYTVMECRSCHKPFLVGAQSDATDCGGYLCT